MYPSAKNHGLLLYSTSIMYEAARERAARQTLDFKSTKNKFCKNYAVVASCQPFHNRHFAIFNSLKFIYIMLGHCLHASAFVF